MDISTALGLQLQQSRLDLGMAMLRVQHQTEQTLVNVLAEQVRAVSAANPEHLGQRIDARA
ncbi:MAG TPA: hypothetical protein PLW81_10920 [Thiobacillaceae bacterium]|nr:hypothetical protein [Thiobacillaceae bacterium]